MSDDSVLRVDPVVLNGVAESLGGGAEALLTRLAALDGRVGEMLAGWQGDSGGAYSSAWQLWHRGAREVQVGLVRLSQLIGEAGVAQQSTEAASARKLRDVGDG